MAGVTICMACRQFGQTLESNTSQPIDRTKTGPFRSGSLKHGELMAEREDLRRELQARANGGSQRGEQGGE